MKSRAEALTAKGFGISTPFPPSQVPRKTAAAFLSNLVEKFSYKQVLDCAGTHSSPIFADRTSVGLSDLSLPAGRIPP